MPNREELLIGFIVGICFMPIIGLVAMPMALATAVLWNLGGADGFSKAYRRIGVPVVCCVVVAIVKQSYIPLLSIVPAWGVLSIGYGIPSTQPKDEGSWLGRLAYKLSEGNESLADLYCRGLIYILLALSFTPCFIGR